ncbi:MAG TPA: DUF3175 domain-containing protein [Hyphomicrobium sp.]|nr:DUF3175 domain-containing protein [Hyphomicrobium sp.]
MAATKPKAKTRTAAKRKPSTARRTAKKATSSARKTTPRKWSQDVTEHSDALTLEHDVFKLDDPKKIAASLKRSAEQSHRRKSEPYRSAMSMLTFYINRAGSQLSQKRKRVLENAKEELRKLFGKD